MGEGGRAKSRAMTETAVNFSQTYLFRLSPAMSTLPATWSEADPFWNRPAAVTAQSGKIAKKK
jgi:hypothetical protein